MVRHCSACNTEKPLTEFTVSTRHAGGYFPICRVCKNEIKRDQERKMKQRDKELAGSEVHNKELVKANLHVPIGTYKPERDNPTGYLRETGNHKYKSKGAPC